MPCNLGGIERAIRAVLGIVLVGIAYATTVPNSAATVLYLIGAILIVTTVVGFCPAWKLFSINTCATTVTRRSNGQKGEWNEPAG
jgi:hypothetical protein